MNVFFRLMAISAVVFIVSIFALIAVTLSNSASPVNRWIDRNIWNVFLGEVLVTLVLGVLAMVVDRRQTQRDSKMRRDARQGSSDGADSDSRRVTDPS